MRACAGDVGLDLRQQVQAPAAPLAMTDDEEVARCCAHRPRSYCREQRSEANRKDMSAVGIGARPRKKASAGESRSRWPVVCTVAPRSTSVNRAHDERADCTHTERGEKSHENVFARR